MKPGRASETALATARLRAAHQVLDSAPLILEDPISIGLVEDSDAEALNRDRSDLDQPFFRALRSSFVARSRITELALEHAVADGVRQFVLLGAGLDTFAWRQPDWAKPLRIFEVDHPASQEDKRARMQGYPVPKNLEFVPIDFERDLLESTLHAAGADPDAPVFVSWLGVIPYLTHDAIVATLRSLRDGFSAGRIALTTVLPEDSLTDREAQVVRLSAAASKARNEPWITHFTPEALTLLLKAERYPNVEHISPEAIKARFFADRSDGLRVAGFERITLARFEST